jgi:hypothetical protein
MNKQSAANELWYYAQGDAVNGPFSLRELLKKAEEGIINSETLVVPVGQEDWRPLANVVSRAESTPTLPVPEVAIPASSTAKTDKPKWWKPDFSLLSPPPPLSKKEKANLLKGSGALVALLVAAVSIWHYWRPLLCLSAFLGAWYSFASSSLKAKRSKVHSIGGGFVLGLLALVLTVKLFGGHKETNTVEAKQAFAMTDAKDGVTQDAQVSERQPTFPMTANEFRAAFNETYYQIGSFATQTINGKPWLVCKLDDDNRLQIRLEPKTDRIREVVCGFTITPTGSSNLYLLARKVTQTLSPDATQNEASHFVEGLASGADGSKTIRVKEELFKNLIVSMDSMGKTNSGLPIVVLDFMPNGYETSREGIISVLRDLQAGCVDLEKLNKTLIIADGSETFAFAVESTTADYVFYHLRYKSRGDAPVQFAILRDRNLFYGEGSKLQGKYFQVVGVETFTTVAGAGKDLLVLRPVK